MAATEIAGSAMRVRCMACGRETAADGPVSTCTACGGLLDAVVDIRPGLTRADFGHGLPRHLRGSGVWRYRALLPSLPDDAIVTRSEGNTPTYWDARIAAYAGVASMGLKHEGQNPTASFKDRGMTGGVSHAKAVGAKVVACASTGNTSASLASYASAAGLAGLVLIPEGKISAGKLSQTIAYGAKVVQVEGDFDRALALLRELVDNYPVYLLNSVNPFRLEGQKTILYEMFEQLDWEIPDVVALPGGNLGNTAAFGKALIDLRAAGLIDKLPRLVTSQAAGSAPFAHYFARGFNDWQPVHAETIATAIKVGDPASVARAKRAIEMTNGLVVSVTDEEILDAKAVIDRAGIGCEPASAASLAGVRKLVAQGELPRDATVVGVLTGHVLKDADAVMMYHTQDVNGQPRANANRPVSIPATLSALVGVLGDALQG